MTTHTLRRAARILLIGPPGSGKGTQLHSLPPLFPALSPLSTGDVLRAEIRAHTPLGRFAASLINKGNILPDTTITAVILAEALKRGWVVPKEKDLVVDPEHVKAGMVRVSEGVEHSFLLDGFPRTAEQARMLHQAGLEVNLVLLLDIPREILVRRLSGRLVHPPSGRVYNTNWVGHPVKGAWLRKDPEREGGYLDVETGEPLVRRDDDDVETVKKRLEGHEKRERDIRDFYEDMGVLWRLKGVEGREVTREIEEVVCEKFC
ncbi:adenylate kinase-like protein [Ascobolus immersus RN42]|uniref:Adenylate kinase-like protein n=1 Tax=Ascobolus immersus RN42 TaxID=1160509 RepID=A0A3N4IQU7_ASCIM|nr:adenylate kinase-like protein [Ascobolus immersus RN42]